MGGCKVVSGVPCEIPFIYNGDYYDTCTNVDNGGKYWCYTNLSNKSWENCDESSCPLQNGG